MGWPTGSDVGFGAGWSLVKNLPEPVVDRIFRAGADAATRRRGPSVVQFARNIRRVLGDRATPALLSEVVHAGMRSYARYWKETFRLPAMDHDDVYERVVRGTVGLEHIDAAPGGRSRNRRGAAALGELGRRRVDGDPALGQPDHRGRTAET